MNNPMKERLSFEKVFDAPDKKAFIAFLTAGDPGPDSTVSFILEMERAGADMIEIGIPFSDPTAEGAVVQEANVRALKGGMTTDGVFEIVRRVRESSRIPLVFVTYANPVFHYGYERFFTRCEELDVSGVVIPDMPFEEKRELEEPAKRHRVAVISVISPASGSRIRTISGEAGGFIYVAPFSDPAEARGGIDNEEKHFMELETVVRSIREATDVPCAIDFGMGTPGQAEKMAAISDGAIAGSAVVKIIAEHGTESAPELYKYVRKMKNAIAGR